MTEKPSVGRRAFLKLALALGGWAALEGSGLRRILGAAADGAPPDVFYQGKRRLPYVALTFDDCNYTHLLQELEQMLSAYPRVKVTFFPTGIALEKTCYEDADLWCRLISQGHEIGCHSYAHQLASTLSAEEMRDDYDLWLEAAEHALGYLPAVRFARPPYGELAYAFMKLCADRSLVPAMWSANWGTAPERAEQEIPLMRGGEIALLHIREADIENTRLALRTMAERGFKGVTLSTLYDASHDIRLECRPGKPCAR